MMMLWGMFGALVVFEKQLIAIGWKSKADVPYSFGLMIVNLVVSVRAGRRIARMWPRSPLDRQANLVLAVVLGVLLLLTALGAVSGAVPEAAMTLFWSAGLMMAFLILGLQGSPLLTACGLSLLVFKFRLVLRVAISRPAAGRVHSRAGAHGQAPRNDGRRS
jgi:hypothetical protein